MKAPNGRRGPQGRRESRRTAGGRREICSRLVAWRRPLVQPAARVRPMSGIVISVSDGRGRRLAGCGTTPHLSRASALSRTRFWRTVGHERNPGAVRCVEALRRCEGGPARRVYRLTREGEKHLEEWAVVLEHLSRSMSRFVSEVRKLQQPQPVKQRKSA